MKRRAVRHATLDSPRWRWRVVKLLDRLPGQCWADLVEWALPWTSRAKERSLPWSPVTTSCRLDAAASVSGRCYCGRIGADGKPYREPTEATR